MSNATSSSGSSRVCRDCGAPLTEDTSASTCARCVLQACFEGVSVHGIPDSTCLDQVDLAGSGETFGDYELLEEIARGGMGVVFKARQRSLGRVVAVKLMLPSWLNNADSVRRFRMEAEAASRLRHPGIVAIHDVGECEGQHFYSMDYIEGKNLAERVAAGPVDVALAAKWLHALAMAIHHAHQHGVLHRDLKPANILIDTFDQPHVADFGLAKVLDNARQLTVPGRLMGTPSFMPPEQADSGRGEVTVASDIYGLGAVLYFILTGRAPFEGNSMEETLRLMLTEEPEPPSRSRPGTPRDLETICLKCLNKSPPRRYSSAAELAEDLAAWSRHEPIRARPVSPVERFWFWTRRNPWLAGLSAGLVLTAAVGAILQQRALQEARRSRAAAEGLVEFMNKDLTDQLRPLGRLRLLDNVNRTVQRYYSGLPMKDTPSDPRSGQAQFHQNNAAVLREMGRLDEAAASARSAIALLEPLAREEPGTALWPASLADAHAEMRNILAASDPAAALHHARLAVEHASRAAGQDTDGSAALLRLANAQLELGSVLQRQRQSDEAGQAVREARAILARLPSKDCNGVDARTQLALASYYQGLLEFDRGAREQARASFADYLQRTLELAGGSSNPSDARMLLNLAVAHSHLGRAWLGQRETAEALRHFREYVRLAETLERLDPGNVNYRRELGLSLEWLGTALEATGSQADEITQLLTRSQTCFQKLGDEFPQGDLWQDHAARVVTHLATWLNQQNQREQARKLLFEEVQRRWTLLLQASERPGNHRRFIQALGWSEELGGPPGALPENAPERFRNWLAQIGEQVAQYAGREWWTWTRATLYHRYASALAGQKQFGAARRELALALPLWQELARRNPEDPEPAAEVARIFVEDCMANRLAGGSGLELSNPERFVEWLRGRRDSRAGNDQVLQLALGLQRELERSIPAAGAAQPPVLANLKQEIGHLRTQVPVQGPGGP